MTPVRDHLWDGEKGKMVLLISCDKANALKEEEGEEGEEEGVSPFIEIK